MAFTGNFYDWIWFSRITTDLLTPLIPLIAFYINGVRMALFFSTLEHDSVSWIFRQFCSEKKGRIWKEEGGIVAADSFQIDWKKRGEIGKSTISIREKMPILWLFYFLMFQTLFWLLNSFNWLISFQIDHWIIPGQLHTPFVVLERNPSIFDCLLLAVLRLEAITNKDHKI